MVCEKETKIIMKKIKMISMAMGVLFLSMCVPPEGSDKVRGKDKAKLDSLRQLKCRQLMSSAAEYYRNEDWEQTVRIYKEITLKNCDELNPVYAPPKEIYQYYAIAYEKQGKFDSSEFVLLDGLQKLPDNVDLRKRLAYSYKKQGKKDKEIIEYERLVDMAPEDFSFLSKLSKLHEGNERYEDQISVLEMMLKLKPEDESIRGDLATAYINSGKDPIDLYREQWAENNENPSYGQQLAKALIKATVYDEAASVLNEVIRLDPTSKLSYRLLADVCSSNNDLIAAAKAYEELFKIDPRDYRVAIEIAKTYLYNTDYRKALKWADKSIVLNKKNGDGYAQKARVYFDAWINLNKGHSRDDKIVAKLAYDYFKKAEEKGYLEETKTKYLQDRKSDFLYGRGDWHMEISQVKSKNQVKTTTQPYDWVTESLKAEADWK